MAQLDLEGLSKRYGGTEAVAQFDLSVAEGELVCLLGPSGSGKSTVLRMIGGFVAPSSGAVRIGGEPVTARPPNAAPPRWFFKATRSGPT